MSLFLMLPTATRPDGSLPADSATMHDINANNSHSGVSVNSDGNVYWVGATGPGAVNKTASDQGTYIIAGETSDFWVQCTGGSNLAAGSDTQTTWHPCTGTVSWYVSDTTPDDGAQTDTFTVKLATDSSGGNVVSSVSYTPSANYLTV